MTIAARRLVTVAIPDMDGCERTLRYAAERMCQGTDVIVVDRHPLIPDAVMPELFAKLTEVVRDAAGQARHHIDKHLSATYSRGY
jgi:hypothetical protein